ncbi:unnamed protein product [Moneuplotes crassus]|uniref:Uncharacterized protein n=1 Tax=Euplotes crassus TaxID=5936 RepID=A0AAD2CZ30_EUPCR|nr:unnamed protein product [Moneuplotes crassus]
MNQTIDSRLKSPLFSPCLRAKNDTTSSWGSRKRGFLSVSRNRNNLTAKISPRESSRNAFSDSSSAREAIFPTTANIGIKKYKLSPKEIATDIIQKYNTRVSNYHQTQKAPRKVIANKFSSYKLRSFIEKEIKLKKNIPDCTKYSNITDWSKKGKFAMSKGPKMRWMWHIFHEAKSKPAPDSYNLDAKKNNKGVFISRENKTYIDEMMYRAYATPGPYDKIDSLILKKSGFKGVSFNAIKSGRFKPLIKTPDPGPATYKIEKSLERIEPKSKGFKISPTKIVRYASLEAKQKSSIPPVGHYKGLDLAYKKAFKPMRRSRR